MESCSVRSCVNFCNYNANVELYPLPVNDEEKSLWAQAFGLTLIDLRNASTRICSNHFRRKYFLGNKPEVKQNVNGSAPLLMWNATPKTSNQAFAKLINSSAFPNFMTLKNTTEPGTYRLHIPDANNVANVHYPSSSSNTSSSVVQASSACSSSPQNILTFQSNAACSSSQNVFTIQPNAICSTSSQNLFTIQPNAICSNSQNLITLQPSTVYSSSSQNVFTFQPSVASNSSSQNVATFQPTVVCNSSQNVSTFQPNVACNNSSQNISTIPNETVQSDSISSEPASNKNGCPELLSTIESCELFCKEENLTPEQEIFQREEWLNFVKFTAKIHNFPYVSAVKGSEVGEKVVDSVSSQELPVLVYTNVPQQSQSVVPPLPTPAFVPNSALPPSVPNSVVLKPPGIASNAPVMCQIPSNISVPLNSVGPVIHTIHPAVSPATPVVSQSNAQSVTIHHLSPTIPVQLEKVNGPLTEKSPVSQSKDEEIFPMVLKDTATENLLDTVNDTSFMPLSPICEISVADENTNESVPSPAFSVSSGNERYMSPDLLCNVEVNIEENGSPLVTENAPAMLGSELECDNFDNGPKIVDVLSGDAGANEFYRGIAEAKNITEQDAFQSQTESVVPSENSVMPKLVTQWSIFSMQKTIAVISSGTAEATVRNLLGLRIHIPPLNAERDIPTRLKNRLREEHFLTLTPWWMIQKRYLPTSPACSKCSGRVFRLNSCLQFLDNLCWICTKCKDITSVKRPKFFERFPSFSLEELLLLTYHWACKSRLWVINYDVPVHVERIWEYFNALQDLCGESVSRDRFIGKSAKYAVTVEVSAVKLGRFFVLCAYDRRNKVSRLKALTTEEACGSLKHIKILEEWLGENCTLITWKKLHEEFLPNVAKLSADPSIGHVQSPGRHILNASKYLGKSMVQLFQNINHEQLTLETVQRILNEVQWRERHGRNEESAFWEILNEINRLNDGYVYTEAQLGEIAKDRFYYKADVPFRLRWGPYDTAAKASITKNQLNSNHRETTIPVTQILAKQLTANTKSSSPPANNFDDIVGSLKKRHPISVSVPPASREQTVHDAPISAHELLSIKIFFTNDENVLKHNQIQANKLGLQLVEQGYLQNPVKWFCKKKFLNTKSTCFVCNGPAILTYNKKFSDGASWLCLKPQCKFENEFHRPAFFASIGFPLNVTLAIIFHWAVQSDYNVVVQAIPMNEFNIIGVHRQLQKLCTDFQPSFKIGGKKQLVEVAFVRFANCFILGAMERSSKCSRFRTFSSDVKLHIDIIRKTLISWLWEDSTVVVNSNKYLGRYSMEEKIHLVFADQSVTDVNSPLYHTLTITSYLQGHIKKMFQSIKVQKMSADLLQIYLDELMWRERYGRSPVDAFNGILKAIFFQNKAPKSLDDDTLLLHAAENYGFSLPLPKLTVSLQRLPDHIIHSYTTRVSNVESITIIDEFQPTKVIKDEPVSDEDVEVVDEIECVRNSESISLSSSSSKTSIASSSSLTGEPSRNTITLELVKAEQNTKKSIFQIKKPDPFSSYKTPSFKRYADKCYSHRRRLFDLKDGKSRCIECKDTISEDHFVKQFTCGDCKCYVFSTHCQKAFARHRSYILFGRKICDDYVFNRSIRLPQKWYCSCGYGSKEGNKLASHLIKCRKSTCYLKSSSPVLIL